MSVGLWNRTLAINVVALVMLSRAAGEAMKRGGGGRIVNITSPACARRCPIMPPMRRRNRRRFDHAVERHRTRALRHHGQFGLAGHDGYRDAARHRARSRARRGPRGFRVPASRSGRAARRWAPRHDEVAAAVIWLALDAPAYITAERLNASGEHGQGLDHGASSRSSAADGGSRGAPRPCACDAPADAGDGARAGPGLSAKGLASPTRSPRFTFMSCAGIRRICRLRTATASCSRPGTIRSRCPGRRWPRPGLSAGGTDQLRRG